MITLEQYTEAVKKALKSLCVAFEDEQVLESYLNEEETKAVIKENYKEDMADLKAGKITETIVLAGCADSTAYCLNLMY